MRGDSGSTTWHRQLIRSFDRDDSAARRRQTALPLFSAIFVARVLINAVILFAVTVPILWLLSFLLFAFP